jgi:hypothetical protein
MGRHKIVDGSKINFTPEEETARDIEEKAFADEQAERAKVRYKRNRKREYPPIGDQLDYIFHNGIEKWKADMILPVKSKYPKGAN